MKYFRKVSLLLLTLMVIGMVSDACATQSIIDNGKTIYVATNGNDGNDGLTGVTAKKTIQNAIDTAKNGDTIQVARGKYQENLLINQKDIKITGENRYNTILDGNQKGRSVYVEGATVVIQHLTIQNGKSPENGEELVIMENQH